MNKFELEQKRARAWEACKNFLDTHETMTAEDEATYNRMSAEMDNCTKEIERIENLEKIGNVLNQPTSTPIFTGTKISTDSAEYTKAFDNYLRKKAFNTYGDLQEDTGSEGGYLVPKEFERTLVKGRDKVDPIFELAHHMSMGTNEKSVPVCANQGAAAIISEEGSYGADGDTFDQKIFKPYKFGRIIKVSDELLADNAFDLQAYIAESLGSSLAKGEATYFWTGTGSSQPEGIMHQTEAITTDTQGSIKADEVIDLYFSLKEQYRNNAVFVFNDSVLKFVRKMKTGDGQYLWTPGFEGKPSTLLGRPVYTSDKIEAMGNGKKVGVFGDFSYYWIGDRSGVTIKRLNELYSANGQVGFRGDARTDGHVMLAEAFKVIKTHA